MNISLKDIKIELGNNLVINEVDMEIKKGEIVGVIGPNGSGKTTLLKAIYRVLIPNGGEIFLGNKNLKEYSIKESARSMSVVAQHNYYNFEFSVHDIVLMGRAPYKKCFERSNATDYKMVDNSLKAVGLNQYGSRDFSTLSGGEQQRVILARALAQNTPCIILDEPTNHLDIKHQLEIMDIVTSLNHTVVAAIHDLNIALMYCDKVFVLKNGNIVCHGNTNEVLTEKTIREVFEVDCELLKNKEGKPRICFNSYK